MKKTISIILLISVIIMACTFGSFAQDNEASQLKFNDDGTFKILFMTDIHYDTTVDGAPETAQIFKEMLDETQPDLIVFGGDNILSKKWEDYDAIMDPILEREIPFTLVFGNHDDEVTDHTREEIFAKFQSYDGCLAYDADPSIHGVGNHNLTILSSDEKSVAFNLWMLDTGSYVSDDLDYDGVRTSQIEWYKSVSDKLAQDNGGKKVSSIVFQHIINQEVAKAAFFGSVTSLDVASRFEDGSAFSVFANLAKYNGIILEKACPSYVNDGEWDAFKQQGDVLAVVTGHDHKNAFEIVVDGITALQSPSFSYCTYGSDIVRGSRVITLNENDTSTFETEIVHVYDLAKNDGSKISELTKTPKFIYTFDKILNSIFSKFSQMTNIFNFSGC